MVTIENELLRVSIEELGAELKSIYGKKTGTEYLWQGDKTYWAGRAYNLFPVIGRLYEGKYDVYGKTYEMPPHGLVRKRMLVVTAQTQTSVTFTLPTDDEMRKSYPFEYVYSIEYVLEGAKLNVNVKVENRGDKTMYYCIGGHPGFNIPFEGGKFEDYFVEFPDAGSTKWHKFSQNILMSGEVEAYPLENGKLPLSHDLFPLDAVVLANTGGKAILSRGGKQRLTVEYPSMPYLGVWHKPQSDAPYVCLEPWSALPARDNVREDFAKKEDLFSLESGKTSVLSWSISVEEKN
ncbi:MAG: aldose 1-epimerase family protein [Clostridia bacterium]|nr:aldose 1-epimerase family protein [Clostridia bacterium]